MREFIEYLVKGFCLASICIISMITFVFVSCIVFADMIPDHISKIIIFKMCMFIILFASVFIFIVMIITAIVLYIINHIQ